MRSAPAVLSAAKMRTPTKAGKVAARYNLRFPKKVEAHKAVHVALKSGALVRCPCETCGEPNAQAHHPDYDKPLDVMWLCLTHHAEWHTKHGPGLNGGEAELKRGRASEEDLTGRRFGSLVCVSAERAGGGRRWLCRCDCGAEFWRLASVLLRGERIYSTQACRECAAAGHKQRVDNSYSNNLPVQWGARLVARVEEQIRFDIAEELGIDIPRERFGPAVHVEPAFFESSAEGTRRA